MGSSGARPGGLATNQATSRRPHDVQNSKVLDSAPRPRPADMAAERSRGPLRFRFVAGPPPAATLTAVGRTAES